MQSQTPPSTLGLRPPESDNSRVIAELEIAKAELVRVKAEAATAMQTTERLRASYTKSRQDAKVRLRVVAVAMLTAALIKIAWLSAQASVTPTLRAAPLPATSGGIATPYTGPAADASNSPRDREFSRSLNRLRDAFNSFPEEDQAEVVREINQRRPGAALACPLVWNDAGVPSLFVGDKKGEAPPSAIAALDQCASEVEKLRIERGPAQ